MTEPLLHRLLQDAQSRASHGEPREALLLLRWAATIASRRLMAHVLLTFHRVRALQAMSDQPASGPSVSPHVESDRLGFPVPRFASRPPVLDRTAFVAAPRFGPPARDEVAAELPTRPRRRSSRGNRTVALVLLVGIGCAAAMLRGHGPADGAPKTEAAESALRLGNAREAVAILDRVPSPSPHALMVRAHALLVLADTSGAAVSVRRAVEHPTATADDAFAGARELARLRCCARAAADAYLLAFLNWRGSNTKYFHHLMPQLGAEPYTFPSDFVAQAVAQEPLPDDEVGPGVYVAAA